jgi:uncharacterized membrane protein YjdF
VPPAASIESASAAPGLLDPDLDSRERRRFLLIAWLATVVLCGISLSGSEVANYRWAATLLVPMVWAVFLLRRRLALRPLHFALFALALLAHDMGAFGWYLRPVLGLQWDWYVHFYFGIVGGLIVARVLQLRLGARGVALGLLTVLAVAGVGALHEISEAASTVVFGEHGMFHAGRDERYDTQVDLLNNAFGASLALGLRALAARRERRKTGMTTRAPDARIGVTIDCVTIDSRKDIAL